MEQSGWMWFQPIDMWVDRARQDIGPQTHCGELSFDRVIRKDSDFSPRPMQRIEQGVDARSRIAPKEGEGAFVHPFLDDVADDPFADCEPLGGKGELSALDLRRLSFRKFFPAPSESLHDAHVSPPGPALQAMPQQQSGHANAQAKMIVERSVDIENDAFDRVPRSRLCLVASRHRRVHCDAPVTDIDLSPTK
jgi:hypothetical protein